MGLCTPYKNDHERDPVYEIQVHGRDFVSDHQSPDQGPIIVTGGELFEERVDGAC